MPATTRHFSNLVPLGASKSTAQGQVGNSRRTAPPHPLYMPGATRHVSTLTPLRVPTSYALGWELTPCSPAPAQHATDHTPRQESRPAERAQIKRTGDTGGNSRRAAPTHPLYMPVGVRNVSTLAPLRAPKSSRLGEWVPKSNQTGWELTFCSPAPVQYAKGKTRQ